MNTISVGFNAYISALIGAEGMGLFTLTGGVYSFAITFATSGINVAVVRLVSAALPYENDKRLSVKESRTVSGIMKRAFLYCLFFSTIATCVLFFLAKPIGIYALGDIRTVPSLKAMALSLIPISLSSAINGYFSAVRRVYKNVVSRFLEQGIKIGAVYLLILVLAPSGLEYACFALAVGGTISESFAVLLNLALYLLDKRIWSSKGDERGAFSVNNTKKSSVFSSAFPVGVSGYVRSALVMIEHLLIPWGLKKNGKSGSQALSSYGILHGMVIPLVLFPASILGSFSSLLVPEIASLYEKKELKRIRYIVERVFYFTLLFAFGVSGVLIAYSKEIGICFYQSTEAGRYIMLLAPLIPVMYLDSSVDAMLKGMGEQLYTMRINIIDSLLSVALIWLILPRLGISGYIIVIFVTELFNTSFSILRLINKLELKPPILRWVVKPLINIIISTGLSKLLFRFILDGIQLGKVLVVVEIVVASLIYIGLSFLTKAISKNEIALAKKLIKHA
ncbi:MAG: polysaccharide biosynthesis protein [Clostridia bacterium]|nr:polysaccharide biosynthesis protein [Clostridia bacterium]